MTMMHETSTTSKRSPKAQEFEGAIAGESLVRQTGYAPEASRRERRLIRRRRSS